MNVKRIIQIALPFVIITVIITAGFAFSINRLMVLLQSHNQIEEEYTEYCLVSELQNTLEMLMDQVVLSSYGEVDEEQMRELVSRVTQQIADLKEDTKTQPFEEARHGHSEEGIYERIVDSWGAVRQKPATINHVDTEALVRQVMLMRQDCVRFAEFTRYELERALHEARRARKQAIERVVAVAVIVLGIVVIVAIWFVVMVHYYSRMMLDKERAVTLGLLAQSLAHEIKNPLGIIKAAASVIAKKLDSTGEEYAMAHDLSDEVDRINELVKQLQSFDAQHHVDKQIESLDPIVAQVIQLSGLHARKKHVAIRYDKQAPEVRCRCNKNQVKQMLLNVLLNAVEVSNEHDIIDVTMKRHDGTCIIIVKDYGKGLTPHEQKNLFTPFYSTKEVGRGLGLTVVKNIVASHDGDIEVRSVAGQGTSLIISLPCCGDA